MRALGEGEQMWKKGVAAGFAAALLVAGLALLHRISSPSVEASNSAPAKKAEPSRAGVASASRELVSTPVSVTSASGDATRAPAPRGPSAGVWRAMGTSHANVAEEREALIAAFSAAPPCIEKWCDEGRTTLAAWQAAIAAKVPGAVTADAAECSSAGCWMKVAVTDPRKWRDVSAALPDVVGENQWPGPSIRGGPDFQTQRGAVVSIWAILPSVPSEPSLQQQGGEQ
jgi:hypothetical protein